MYERTRLNGNMARLVRVVKAGHMGSFGNFAGFKCVCVCVTYKRVFGSFSFINLFLFVAQM